MTINFEKTLGDYKRNEQMAMQKLDQIEKNQKGSKGGMQASVAATEEIRTWVSTFFFALLKRLINFLIWIGRASLGSQQAHLQVRHWQR